MSVLKFTNQFKHKLAQGLENYFFENGINLGVETEYRTTVGEEENRIDVAIVHPNKDNRLIGIELEIVSCKEQIFKNYNKFRKWVHASPSRKGALLHVMTDNSNITQTYLYELLFMSYEDIAKAHGFFYEFFVMDVDDYRKYKETSDRLININWEFDARLFALIAKVFGRRYIV